MLDTGFSTEWQTLLLLSRGKGGEVGWMIGLVTQDYWVGPSR